jgi:interleukin-1 receptor-associated kinase 1
MVWNRGSSWSQWLFWIWKHTAAVTMVRCENWLRTPTSWSRYTNMLFPTPSLDAHLYTPAGERSDVAGPVRQPARGRRTARRSCAPGREDEQRDAGRVHVSFTVKLVDDGRRSHTTGVAGTTGYMDPECIYASQLAGRASVESDIYSFGALLLDIILRRRRHPRRGRSTRGSVGTSTAGRWRARCSSGSGARTRTAAAVPVCHHQAGRRPLRRRRRASLRRCRWPGGETHGPPADRPGATTSSWEAPRR